MKRKWNIALSCILLMANLAACTSATQTSVPELATIEPTSLSLDTFTNSEFFGQESQRTVQLSNGKYEGGSGADYLLVNLLPQAAFGDINGDGSEDAVVLLAENMGGSGVFVTLNAMVSNGSGFTQLTPVLIDDRPLINSVLIQDGRIELNATIHGINDDMATPTEQVVEQYTVSNGKLVLTNFNSKIFDAARTITITSPVNGQEVTGTIQVKGGMPITPFENSMVYYFYDMDNNLIESGAFMVNAADMGGPATFDNTLTIPTAAAGSEVRFELADLSMADGSILCLASVKITVK